VIEKHTPGPWKFRPKLGEYDCDMGAFLTEKGETIMNFGDSEQYYNTCGDPPNEANAALIVSAPDLLEACKILVNQYDESGDFRMGGMLTNEGFLLARKAIQKAEVIE